MLYAMKYRGPGTMWYVVLLLYISVYYSCTAVYTIGRVYAKVPVILLSLLYAIGRVSYSITTLYTKDMLCLIAVV